MNWKKFIVASDVHGDMQDAAACRVFFNFVKAFNPDIKVFAGDLWDFRAIRKGASEDERQESMAKDYTAGLNWLKTYQPHYFLRGNHDERLWELADSDKGVMSDYAQSGVVEITSELAKMRCRMLPYHKREGVLKLGSLKVLHGFHCGVFAARQTALVYGSALFGHTHVIDEHSIGGLDRRVARNIGALCQLDMDYNSRNPNTLRQAHGFAYGILNERTGCFHVQQAEEINGNWMLPSDFKSYK
jgi:predicted phosphodiesterase